MPSSKETREMRNSRIDRELAEDQADRVPVYVRKADGSYDNDEAARINTNNMFTDINRRVNREFGPRPPRESDDANRRAAVRAANAMHGAGMKKGGQVKRMAKGGVVRGDGCAIRGKTRGKIV